MIEDAPFNLPDITDEDIRWAASLLGLPENAFHGEHGDDPRLEVLKCMKSTEVAACPGSGKTTLLVAKLAILANKWEHRTRGICVLSHTNAARHEIEERLGSTSVGRQLLAYPHNIGTIHGFVDGFLAMPWLRSRGYSIKMIDTTVCENRRWKKIPYRFQSALQRKRIDRDGIRIISSYYRWTKKTGNCPFSETTNTYNAVLSACKNTAQEGFHCYNDMFIWAGDLIDETPEILNILRDRFPVLFIDEAQDNSEEQSKLLHRVFMDGEDSVLRQRFGDSNQAIYNFVGAKGATTDVFPNPDIKKSVPNSHRFGSTIAKLTEPLGFDPREGGLTGNGPRPICRGSCIPEGPHTIFLFQDDTIDKVLPAYTELLIKTFSEEELKHGVFTAVGQVHRKDKDDNRPRHVGHYWPDYDSELSKANPQPQTFVQYVRVGQEQAETTSEIHFGVEKIAQGILRLAAMAEGGRDIRLRRRNHRYILELLEEEKATSNLYRLLIRQMIVRRKALTKRNWNECWAKCVKRIGEKIAGVSLSSVDAEAFLEWCDMEEPVAQADKKTRRDNIYRYPKDAPKVHIKMGSIHSVKGQTHTATLVLETFWHKHNLETLKEWLMGTRCGGTDLGKRERCRLKLHYVAMSRPTHLLCIAMKRDSFDENNIKRLQEYGWRVKCV